MDQRCPFCDLENYRITAENDCAVAIPDGCPVTEGPMLVVPNRHVGSLLALTEDAPAARWTVVPEVGGSLPRARRPQGCRVRASDGAAAGQTVVHAHVAVIPRRAGHVSDPRRGVRRVVPGKAKYWAEEQE